MSGVSRAGNVACAFGSTLLFWPHASAVSALPHAVQCPTAQPPVQSDVAAAGVVAGFEFGANVSAQSDSPSCGAVSEYVVEPACASAEPGRFCVSEDCGSNGEALVAYEVVGGVTDEAEPKYFCSSPAEPAVTSARVLREIRRIGLPTPTLSVQPPGGRTLVNFPTIFSTAAERIERSIRVARIPVEVEIWPASYAWLWGDGSAVHRTEDPGRAYATGVAMAEYLTHQYARTGRVQPRVSVTYAARFRVRGGAWRDVGGTVTQDGAPTSLLVVEARPTLVGAD